MMKSGANRPDDVNEVARAWYLRLVSGDLRRGEMHDLEKWIAEDLVHREAFGRARAVYASAVGDPMAIPRKVDRRARQARSRTIAAVACAGLVLIATIPSLPWLFADQATHIGEVRRVDLADGTVAFLDTASAIDTDFSDKARTVRIRAGRAWFDVAHEARPFHVTVGSADIVDVGTAFSVRIGDHEAVDVAVERGMVAVTANGTTRRLQPGMEGVFSTKSEASLGQARESSFKWREGRLSFSNRPLKEVVAEIGRYRRGAIYVTDDAAANRRVSAMLTLNSLDSGIRALAESQGLRVRTFTPWLTIMSKKQ